MKRPSFQFYTGDWFSNVKLRRCTPAARGVWMDLLCLFHGSEEYGVIRWPLADIAQACGSPIKLLRELADKGVLKGGDKGCEAYVYTPRHAGRDGKPETLLESVQGSPCWYCSRFLRDEHVRKKRGEGSRFTSENQPENVAPFRSPKRKPPPLPAGEPLPSPKPPLGDGEGDGPSSSSSSSASAEDPCSPQGDGAGVAKTVLPDGWGKIPRGEQKLRKVNCNNRLMQRIGRWFGRSESRLWTLAEGIALHRLDPEGPDIELLERYYLADLPRGEDFRRRDLITLLNNWAGELDRARIWSAESA